MKIIVRAGGVGTRLWPWSRFRRPKQFLPMFDGKSCVQVACERFLDSGLVGSEDIYVSVGEAHKGLVREQLPDLPDGHLIVEPASRDTAAAIGLETVLVAPDSPQSVLASLGSDHYCGKPGVFVRALKAAEAFMLESPDYLVAIACEPTRVETGYGHIKKGEVLGRREGMPIHCAEEFTEKPVYPDAVRYTESGDYLWNSNFFVWTAGTLMELFAELEPEMHEQLTCIRKAVGTADFQRVLEEVYPAMKKTAIDYALLEPASRRGRLAVLPVAMDWSDIGTWGSLTDAFPPDRDGNLLDGPVLVEETTNSTVVVKNPLRKVVVAIGVDGLAIVDTEDALLICPKEISGKVKKLVMEMKDSGEWGDVV